MGFLDRFRARMPFAPERRSRVSESFSPGDVGLAEVFGRTSDTAAGMNVTPDNARNCPEVDACVGLIENTIATVPLDLFELLPDGSRKKRDDHPLHALLHDQPNSWQTSSEFRQMMEGWRSTHGNAYAEIVWGMGGPIALEPMYPLRCWPFPYNGAIAYQYTPLSGPVRILLQSQVLHLRDSPACAWRPFLGESRVTRHRETIGRAMATAEYMSRFFSNNATPKAAIISPGALNDDQANKIIARWEQKHAGPQNAHRLALLEAGFDIKVLGVSNVDAQLIESYRLAVAQLARIWGIPLHLIGEVTSSTSWGTGIEQQSIGFIVYYMRPKFVIWEQALNAALMSSDMRKRFFFEFNVDGLLRGDFKTRMEGYALMIQWGLATPNEIRRQMNLPALPGGDERLIPLNMAPASRIMDVLLRNPAAGAVRSGPDADAATIDEFTRALVAFTASTKVAA